MASKPTPSIKLTAEKVTEILDMNKTKEGEDFSLISKMAALPTDMLPGMESATIEKYANFFSKMGDEVFKSISMPPDMIPFNRLSTQPSVAMEGIIQWPGVFPGTMKKIAAEHVAAQMILGMREDDILRYANVSSHPWKPGWRIEVKEVGKHPSPADLKKIREAELFLQNSNVEINNPIERDEKKLARFSQFLTSTVRASLTYDGIGIWTDRANNGKVKAFAALDPANIRLVNQNLGYKGDKKIFAVAMDDALHVVRTFTREDFVWYIRNPRLDVDTFGYGYSEIVIACRLIQGFTNALEMNLDIFNANSIPPGILKLKGAFSQKQVDFWNRLWTNIKRGSAKSWVMPVVRVPVDGDIDVLDLSRLKDNDVYYKEFMNMVMGAFATVYRFPVHRLGYKISGGPGHDEVPKDEPQHIDEQDIGLISLLTHLEILINEYLLGPNYPDLKFCFTGKNPKEDAYEVQQRTLAWNVDERRASFDLPPWAESVKQDKDEDDEEFKERQYLARIMGMCPTDPGLAGVFQAIASSLLKSKQDSEDPEAAGARFKPQKDPTKSAKHGHKPALRRGQGAVGSDKK